LNLRMSFHAPFFPALRDFRDLRSGLLRSEERLHREAAPHLVGGSVSAQSRAI
jgi:hypothetical protein